MASNAKNATEFAKNALETLVLIVKTVLMEQFMTLNLVNAFVIKDIQKSKMNVYYVTKLVILAMDPKIITV